MPYLDVEGEISENLEGFVSYQTYNNLDSAMTSQIARVLRPQINQNPDVFRTYNRERRVQQMCLELSTNGFPIDSMALAELLYDLDKKRKHIEKRLAQFCDAVDHPMLNPRSPKQVAEFFYEHLGLPVIHKWDAKTKKRTPSTDAKALEKLRTNYPIAAPFVNAILGLREVTKMISVFKRGLEAGNPQRLRCNYTPTGTETGRLSSQQNPYGRGTNAQNLTNKVRQVIKAPAGFCFLNIDLKTAESIGVGYISGSVPYIEACLGKLRPDGTRTRADLHTSVAQLVWRSLSWTGDLSTDRGIAEGPFYRHFSYRDMAKRGGHGTNYYGTPPTMAAHLKVQRELIEEFQREYFAAFPEIPEWHTETIARIQREGKIITQLGRVRQFWGRPNDKATHREAIAYHPQSLIGDVMNEGLLQVLDWIKRCNVPARLIAQVHDSGLFLAPIHEVADICRELQKVILYPVDFGSLGTMVIPTDAEIGLTWCKKPKNPEGATRYELAGLRGYTPGDDLSWMKAAA